MILTIGVNMKQKKQTECLKIFCQVPNVREISASLKFSYFEEDRGEKLLNQSVAMNRKYRA